MSVRFRQNIALSIASFLALVGASAVAVHRWWLVPVLVPPALALWWALRSGVDADAVSIRVRGAVGSRTIPWADVSGVRVQGRRVLLVLASGELPLPAVEPEDLPLLVRTSGGALPAHPG